jgi:pimeloyl-ACP methyl ester carboxylesterase
MLEIDLRSIAAIAIALALPIAASEAQTVPATAPARDLYVIDPFLLGAPSLKDINLQTLLPKHPNFSSIAADALVADNVSAAIALYRTPDKVAVTFTVNDGATLAPYSDNFLELTPAAGKRSLTVEPKDFVKVGSNYYAPALVQAPAVGVEPSFKDPIVVTGTQFHDELAAKLPVVPPPVVLVHGLWGDASSLQAIQDYLRSIKPWGDNPGTVNVMQYSADLAFNYAEPKSPPSRVPPASSLGSAIQTALAHLDKKQFVGGRVDIIAHSMGGLVSRYFSQLGAYRSLRDRNMGQFHEIVTVDTPETGSEIATFLIDHRNDREQAPSGSESGEVWDGLCGSGSSTTVMTCFDSNAMPLVPLSGQYKGSLAKGPVQPLDPGSPDLSDLKNPPSIPDAIWRANSAIAPSDSALARSLNDLIGAVYSNPNTAPKINGILQNLSNDALVTVKSQIDTAKVNQYATLKNMSHSPASQSFLDLMSALGVTVDNDNVTNDSAVNILVACWLVNADGPSQGNECLPKKKATNQPAMAMQPASGLGLVNRLIVSSPGSVKLATPFELSVQVAEANQLRGLYLERAGTAPQPLVVSHRSGGNFQIAVTPTALGVVPLRLLAVFNDRAISVSDVTLNVQPTDTPPQSFVGDASFDAIRLGLEDGVDLYALHPEAFYAATDDTPIDVRDWVQYSVVPDGGSPPVEVRPDGTVVALHAGTATIEERFGAASDRIAVTVQPLEH